LPPSRPPHSRVRTLAAASALAAAWLAAAAVPAAARGPAPRSRDELLVRVRAGVSRDSARALVRGAGGEPVAELPELRVQRVRVAPGERDAARRRLVALPDVEWVEENRAFEPLAVPDDPLYTQQWHLPTIGAPAAWDLRLPGAEPVVAILDSGVDPDHPDVQPQLLAAGGWNEWDDDADTSDVTGHGTKVAGAAAAIADNGAGVASPAWRSLILPIRVTDPSGVAYASTLADGLARAANAGARIANLSFGGVVGSPTVREAARLFVERGGVVIAGAGNAGGAEPWADTPWILSVSATDELDAHWSGSSTGSYLDLAAPGVRIRTTLQGGAYGNATGTSYAGPVVAGVVALMLGAQPGLTPADVESILEGTARDLGPPGWDPAFGHGRIDAAAAVALAQIVVREAPPACDDGLDNDGDGWVDHPADVGCGDAADPNERSSTACGLGFELAAALPALAARLRRAGRHGAARRG
jgi:subtilisin family serine protease